MGIVDQAERDYEATRITGSRFDVRPQGQENLEAREAPAGEPITATRRLPAIEWTSFSSVADLLTPPGPPEWQLEGIYPRGAACAHFGDPKTNKSTFERQHAIHVAAGVDLCGLKQHHGKALIICAEDDLKTVMSGVRAYVRYYGFKPSELEHIVRNLLFVSARGSGFRLVTLSGKTIYISDEMQGLAALVQQHNSTEATPIVLAIVDTVARTLDGEESNEAMNKAVQAAELLCELGVAVVLIHHTSKFAARELDLSANASRGGSSFPGAVRANVAMHRLDLRKKHDGRLVSSLLDEGIAVPSADEVESLTLGMSLPARVDWSTRLRLFRPINTNYGPTAPPLWFVMCAHEHYPVLVHLPFSGNVHQARERIRQQGESKKRRALEVKEKERLGVVVRAAMHLHEQGTPASKTAIHKACAGTRGLSSLAVVDQVLKQALRMGLLETYEAVIKNNSTEAFRPGKELAQWLDCPDLHTPI